MMRLVLLLAGLSPYAEAAANVVAPVMPKEYSAVIRMTMPYIGVEMPLRVLTSAEAQKIEYYDGLQVDVHNANGTYKYSFNNSVRTCLYTPSSAGPRETRARKGSALEALTFLPNLTQYTFAGDELVGGILCQKFTFYTHRSAEGLMDDHISFYWDAVLGKPVRWHMHARHVTFGSHTDEYIMDYLSFQLQPVAPADLVVPEVCAEKSVKAEVSSQLREFLAAVQAPSMVKELNLKHAGTTRFRESPFHGLTSAEVLRVRGGKRQGSSRTSRRTLEHQQLIRVHQAPEVQEPLPKDFDWRTARPGVVGPVKDQGMCGSCWAYGAIEPIESIQAVQTGKFEVLPEQFIVDCAWTNNTGASHGNLGCDGGDPDIGVLEIVRKFGGIVPTAAAYGTYLSVNGYCKDTRLMDVGAKVTGWVDIKARDEQALLHALVTKGPISIGIQVPEEMLYYESGVLKVDSCKNDATQIDHAVVLTGYGTDEKGIDYYTIRNSWSTYWGDEGYVKIARGDNDCCVSCEAGYPELDALAQVMV